VLLHWPPRKTGQPQISPYRNGTAGTLSCNVPKMKIKIPLKYISTPRQSQPYLKG
jgi:hypothetical protein